MGTARKTASASSSRPVSHFLREWRRERGLSQAQLGERIGVLHAAISKIERGESALDEMTLLRLAKALEIEPGDLYRDPSDRRDIWAIAARVARLQPAKLALAVSVLEALEKDD